MIHRIIEDPVYGGAYAIVSLVPRQDSIREQLEQAAVAKHALSGWL